MFEVIWIFDITDCLEAGPGPVFSKHRYDVEHISENENRLYNEAGDASCGGVKLLKDTYLQSQIQ